MKELARKILESGFKPTRQSKTAHDSLLLESESVAVDIHSSGRFTVMRKNGEKNEIVGTNDIDEVIKELLKNEQGD